MIRDYCGGLLHMTIAQQLLPPSYVVDVECTFLRGMEGEQTPCFDWRKAFLQKLGCSAVVTALQTTRQPLPWQADIVSMRVGPHGASSRRSPPQTSPLGGAKGLVNACCDQPGPPRQCWCCAIVHAAGVGACIHGTAVPLRSAAVFCSAGDAATSDPASLQAWLPVGDGQEGGRKMKQRKRHNVVP